MTRSSARHEFRVVIENIELSQDVVERINVAVQQAAVAEIANIDFGGDLLGVLRPWGRGGHGGLWGISFDRIIRDGLPTPPEP